MSPENETFRTVCRIAPSPQPLDPEEDVLLLGSCFAENIGSRMRRAMLPATVNPTGILFNPESVRTVIEFALSGEKVTPQQDGDLWFSWLLSGDFTCTDRETFQEQADAAMQRLRTGVATAKTLIVTFGTAIVYVLAEPPFTAVANCHKQPSRLFVRDMLTPQAIAAPWHRLIERLRVLNPGLRIIFTVSPVRHLKEGQHANTLSKSILHLAVDMLTHALENVEYFPAYELLIDDLRDYRFCTEDLAHPTPQAADYIFARFRETYYSEASRRLLNEAESLRRRLDHRFLHPESAAAADFRQETARLLAAFQAAHPRLVL